jgi:hypothetical protein
MAELQSPENKPVDVANSTISAGLKVAEEALKALLSAEAPWTRWPVISTFTDFILSRIISQLEKFFSEHSTFLIIDFQTAAEKKKYMQSIEELKAAIPTGDKDAIEKARQKAKEDLANLIRFGSH